MFLFLGIIFRYNLLSCIYLLFILALPFTPQLSLVNLGKYWDDYH